LYGCESWSLTLRVKVGWGFSRIWFWARYWVQEGWGNREVEKTTYRWALWSLLFYDLYCFMICTALWSALLYDLHCFTIYTALRSVLLYDLHCFMICTALRSVLLYDLLCFMICTALW